MKIEPHWKTEPWEYREPYAIYVPGLGLFGGFDSDVAQFIVASVNANQKIAKAVNDLMSAPGFSPHLEGL
jgi:hypothetical protein